MFAFGGFQAGSRDLHFPGKDKGETERGGARAARGPASRDEHFAFPVLLVLNKQKQKGFLRSFLLLCWETFTTSTVSTTRHACFLARLVARGTGMDLAATAAGLVWQLRAALPLPVWIWEALATAAHVWLPRLHENSNRYTLAQFVWFITYNMVCLSLA